HDIARQCRAAGDRAAARHEFKRLHVVVNLGRESGTGRVLVDRALQADDRGHIRFTDRAADLTNVSSTVCKSKEERLMTLRTSAVAVCCCRDSRSSLSRRAFSMAITA